MKTICQGCKDRECCPARAVTERESIFAWAAGLPMGCEDYVENSYHGLEGCYA